MAGAGLTAGREAASPQRWCHLLVVLALSACGDEAVGPGHLCGDPPALAVSQTVSAALTPDDRTYDGSYIDYYSMHLGEAAIVTVTMVSSTIDPYLYLWRGDDRTPVAQAYDASGSIQPRVARLGLPLAAGCYRVGASAWDRGSAGLGVYALEASRADAQAAPADGNRRSSERY